MSRDCLPTQVGQINGFVFLASNCQLSSRNPPQSPSLSGWGRWWRQIFAVQVSLYLDLFLAPEVNLHDKSGRIRGIYWYWILTQFTANIATYIEYWIPNRDSKYWQYIECWKKLSELQWFWAILERFWSEFLANLSDFHPEFKWFSPRAGPRSVSPARFYKTLVLV